MSDVMNVQKEEEIFKVFLAHWINHTGDHIEGYQEWADKLKGTSMNEVSKEIYLAIDKMTAVQRKFTDAKIHFN